MCPPLDAAHYSDSSIYSSECEIEYEPAMRPRELLEDSEMFDEEEQKFLWPVASPEANERRGNVPNTITSIAQIETTTRGEAIEIVLPS